MVVVGGSSAETDGAGGYGDFAAGRKTARLARKDLDARIEDPEVFDPVPCSKCYRYQPYMRDRVAEERFGWQGAALGISLLALGGPVAAGAGLAWAAGAVRGGGPLIALVVGVGAALAGTVSLVAFQWAAARYDPNTADLAERKRRAKRRALALERFDAKQLDRARKIYDDFEPFDDVDGADEDNPFENQKVLVLDWWVLPSVLADGGTIALPLSEKRSATVVVPAGSQSGDVLDLRVYTPKVAPFKVRVLEIPTHPDE
jgi:hypothetical protein